MAKRGTPQISSRKQPQQARSTDLVAAILTAAVQVLEQEGATRFTTARVAEKAGVSIGSLYQYFPNKAAILFQLQSDEWRRTVEMMQRMLEDVRRPPLERLRRLVLAFIQSECEEADIRGALNDAAPLYRDALEARRGKAAVQQAFRTFMKEALPHAAEERRLSAGDLILTTLNSAGKQFSESSRTAAEIETYASAMSDMFCAYLREIA
ncbi:MAG: TetR family transcriptional regulator [Deltaproteobacteria bacterium]|jgi:AcrR family transcriptional regulator|nr:TetR family transcriptional regulator [Deltaproteobacteria bacterium]